MTPYLEKQKAIASAVFPTARVEMRGDDLEVELDQPVKLYFWATDRRLVDYEYDKAWVGGWGINNYEGLPEALLEEWEYHAKTPATRAALRGFIAKALEVIDAERDGSTTWEDV